MKKETSASRALRSKAIKGNVASTFQLVKRYEDESDNESANKLKHEYHELLKKHSKTAKLHFDKLIISGFKGFSTLEIRLSKSNLSVFVGNNGSGKSTVLEAISKSLSWLIKNIISDNTRGSSIELNEINTSESVTHSSLTSTLSLNKESIFNIQLITSKKAASNKLSGNYMSVKSLSSIYRYLNEIDSEFNMPLIAYYPVERSIELSKADVEKNFINITKKPSWEKIDGYEHSLTAKNSFDLFMVWFKHFDDISNEMGQNPQLLEAEITSLKNELNSPLVKLLREKAETDDSVKFMLESYINEREEKIKSKLTKKDSDLSRVLEFVTHAIYAFMPSFSNLRVTRWPDLDMLIDKEGVSLSISQLSQGEKSLLALVGDIARRLVILNPSLQNPLDGNGIVLIDEIDLHLHPKWQQAVISNLQKTFKNIQFIITTHSPIVVSTVHHNDLFILDDGEIIAPPVGSKGAESSRVLKRIFQVDNRPKNDEITVLLRKYEKLVYNDKWMTPDATKLRKDLDESYGKEDPALDAVDLYIETRTWEMQLEKDNKK
ncbi:retron Ec78 anti-phage system effector ATPase PtuA [Aeromonas hydrophila]|uniref:retron Ec78 anti-phage system effector ATPase PtuA n=1 Tax=Aeromonas hydrophila TaxID=644 RepID=UPI0038D25A07